MAHSQKPLISIITPCLNAEATLRDALLSVEIPASGEVEHLIIDACSSDGTLAEASRHAHLRVISEPDAGIYDGMNKGARLARGEWLLFLQADDWLPAGSLKSYLLAIGSCAGAVMICGGAEAVRSLGDEWRRVWSVTEARDMELNVRNIVLGEPMINARLIRRDAFLSLGGFSLEYRLASDRDFLLRAAESGLRQLIIEHATYRYRWHAGSSTMTEGNQLSGRLLKENILIAKRHLDRVTAKEKSALRCWHTRLRVQGAMTALESGKALMLLDHALAGTASDPLWMFAMLHEIFRSLPGFVGRGFRTRSRMILNENHHE
jgi:glycosyltransferase involved in cell wall biosynthesis